MIIDVEGEIGNRGGPASPRVKVGPPGPAPLTGVAHRAINRPSEQLASRSRVAVTARGRQGEVELGGGWV